MIIKEATLKKIIVVLMLFGVSSVWGNDGLYNSYPYSYRANPYVDNTIVLQANPYRNAVSYPQIPPGYIYIHPYYATPNYQHGGNHLIHNPYNNYYPWID